jgi:hypothetical protein
MVTDEISAQARGMPGGAAGEFSFLDQDNIGPALFGQVIKQIHTQ